MILLVHLEDEMAIFWKVHGDIGHVDEELRPPAQSVWVILCVTVHDTNEKETLFSPLKQDTSPL